MRFKLGLTGSIGMGKSTTAQMFADAGCVVWDADATVHQLYGLNGAAVGPISDLFPQAVQNGVVSRAALRSIIASDKQALSKIETLIHPLVSHDRQRFIANHPDKIGVFDIPLLFETGGDSEMDATVCVYVPRETQLERVLARGTMNAKDLDHILARQMPAAEKCALATYVIETDTMDHARSQVQDVLADISERQSHA